MGPSPAVCASCVRARGVRAAGTPYTVNGESSGGGKGLSVWMTICAWWQLLSSAELPELNWPKLGPATAVQPPALYVALLKLSDRLLMRLSPLADSVCAGSLHTACDASAENRPCTAVLTDCDCAELA